MRIRKDVVSRKADTCRRGITNGDMDPAWYTCVYCGKVSRAGCLRQRISAGDKRRCDHCGAYWLDRFRLLPGVGGTSLRWRYVGSGAIHEDS